MAVPSVELFPWETLPALRRAELNARLEAEQSFDLTRLGACLHDLLHLDLEEIQVQPGPLPPAAQTKSADCWLHLPNLSLLLRVEPELAALAVSRIVGKPLRVDNGQALAPGIHGAFEALVHALSRQLARHEPPQREPLEPAGLPATAQDLDWRIDFTLRVNGAWYRASLAARATVTADVAPRSRNTQLTACLPIRLEAVAAACHLSVDELAQLGVGDVLLPGAGWLGALDAAGPYYLCAPGAETALHVIPKGQALEFTKALQLAPEPASAGAAPAANGAAADLEAHVRATTTLALLEVGSLTLPATDWLGLKAGDRLPWPQPGQDAAVLRVAGKRLAWGDLVTIEGEPGLCIRGLFTDTA